MESIHINQLGYRPNDKKKAVLPVDAVEFDVVRICDNDVLYSSKTGEPRYSFASGEIVRIADFSELTELGEYKVVSGENQSYPFVIDENPYGNLSQAVLEFFHYQKCGVNLDADEWSHAACHASLAHVIDKNGVKTGEKKDVSGGWHDAGDYGRYIVPAAQTVAQLLLAYEHSPNPDPVVLNIVWFEIEWMLKMQDKKTGGVYHKVSCHNFDALDEMPDDEKEELVICPISATATADFAASIALASRFYAEREEELLNAATRAWQWCIDNPQASNFKNPPGVNTGGYGDPDCEDERFWAACELFVATGDEKYHNYIQSAELSTGLGWRDMGTFGLIAYLLHTGDKADPELKQLMKHRLMFAAQDIYKVCKSDPYGISLGTNYRWGSNMDVANNAMTMLLAGLFEKTADYQAAALEHINYLLGKNALSQSYISGFGSKPMKNPHHRPSVAVGKTVPGMVAGGPNGNTRADSALHQHCSGMPPMKCYVDHIDSCASNEIAIYWNSPVYFVLSFLGL
ncbi:MAG: glycoside hydrolase family 9 protein [Oscillospiraceae bacterium]|nr:glycoside hydrolase family 9 protein [Oscillospiraceae bacterium]